ncbi:unnamed protein product [Ectocarpus fasciculatus]
MRGRGVCTCMAQNVADPDGLTKALHKIRRPPCLRKRQGRCVPGTNEIDRYCKKAYNRDFSTYLGFTTAPTRYHTTAAQQGSGQKTPYPTTYVQSNAKTATTTISG